MHLDLDGLSLHVQEVGDGPPLVLVHGLLLGSVASFYFTAAPALAKAHRVVLYDLRGHGLSSRPASGYDVATLVGDLERLVDRCLPSGPFDLGGHSYGALIALSYAMRHPGRVRKLAVIEAPLPPSRFVEMTAFLSMPKEEMLAALPAGVRARVERGGRSGRRFLEGLEALATKTSLLGNLRAERDWTDAELARVVAPTLLLFGRDSRCLEAGHRLTKSLSSARLEVLEGGHFLHLERTAEVTSLMVEHFA